MQEVFEKIKEKMLKRKALWEDKSVNDRISAEKHINTWNAAIEIVDRVAEEYNNNCWIPVEKAMPEEYDSLFAKLKDTDKWRSSMFEKSSDIVQVTVTDNHGNSKTTTAHTLDGKWSCDILRINSSFRITHWQPLSEPYQSKRDKE